DSISSGNINTNSIWTTDETTGAIKLAISQSLDLNNQDMKNVRSILSSSGKWSISEEGVIVVEAVSLNKLCLEDQCLDEHELKGLLEMKAELINSGIYKVKSTTPVVETNSLQGNDPVVESSEIQGDASITEEVLMVDESANNIIDEQPTTTEPTITEEESETSPEPITEPTPLPEPEPTPAPEITPEPVVEPTPESESEPISEMISETTTP
ncbi:MAG: polymerase III, gamma subunit / DNA polymerase III, tau subunit protein, partial [Parcubacteria group bacterium GW2011_GWF2_38_76]